MEAKSGMQRKPSRAIFRVVFFVATMVVLAGLCAGSYWQARRVADKCAEERGLKPSPWHKEFGFWWTEHPSLYPEWRFWYDGVGVDIPVLFPLKSTAETYTVMIQWG